MKRPLTDAEFNHLRRLLAWIDLEVGQDPEQLVATMKKVAPAVGDDVSDEARLRLKESYDKAVAVPKYVRAAIKALRKTLIKHEGEVMDVDAVRKVEYLEGAVPDGQASKNDDKPAGNYIDPYLEGIHNRGK